MNIYCVQCARSVTARLTSGKEIYPHRPDLYSLPFWKCDACGNFVGCHHRTANRTRPLGSIPSPEIRQLRKAIHAELDPIWRSRKMRRGQIYARLTALIGREYHTAELIDPLEGEAVLEAVREMAK